MRRKRSPLSTLPTILTQRLVTRLMTWRQGGGAAWVQEVREGVGEGVGEGALGVGSHKRLVRAMACMV